MLNFEESSSPNKKYALRIFVFFSDSLLIMQLGITYMLMAAYSLYFKNQKSGD